LICASKDFKDNELPFESNEAKGKASLSCT
jgi:hypothetical protein